ncbi:hypothetical protein LWC34_45510 [Kibdelosporangium philippinense]|uniref:MobA/VirD2-like nuclease domain-containing protein n=1 Tax=Kibdelosporangium philippinense TaxID=211113 RepID=A0ABS8ZS18_9PSEU|nr:hypothetical protein [Kibdelosporangium philippinense]MCE7010018.1 hypothetical protein [Kibdelosporangium philippinense]
MIAKAPAKGKYGSDTYGLLRYLFGPGKSNEHRDQHLVAAWDPEWLAGGAFANRYSGWLPRLAREIDAPMTGHDVEVPGGHVYHVVLSVPRQDGVLGDARWRELVEEAIDRMGFGPDSEGRAGCRWVAVHHGPSKDGNDHVHLALNLVRGDGTIADTYRDWPRWRRWCMEVERHLDLTPTSPANKTAPLRPTRAETEKAARLGWKQPSREYLREVVRAAALEATSAKEFVGLVRQQMSVSIEPRWGADGELSGYRVAQMGDRSKSSDAQIWFSGSSLARDLSAPKLTRRWASAVGSPSFASPRPASRAERLEAITAATDTVTHARDVLAANLNTDDAASVDTVDGIAHAALDLLTATARGVEGPDAGPITAAATTYQLAAATPRRVQPTRWAPTAVELRAAARRLAQAGALSRRGSTGVALVVLIVALASLIAEVSVWRELTQQRQQSDAARRAADLLQSATDLRENGAAVRPERIAGVRLVPSQRDVSEVCATSDKQAILRPPAVGGPNLGAEVRGSGRAR